MVIAEINRENVFRKKWAFAGCLDCKMGGNVRKENKNKGI